MIVLAVQMPKQFLDTINADGKLDNEIFDFRPIPAEGWNDQNLNLMQLRQFVTMKTMQTPAWQQSMLATCNQHHVNSYISVNPKEYVGSVIKGTWQHQKKQWFMHLDWDGILPADLLALLVSKNIPPTTLVETSPACCHAWWRFINPVLQNSHQDVLDGTMLNRRLNLLLTGTSKPDKCYDVTRILRLPGTTNYPSPDKIAKGRVQCSVKLFHGDKTCLYDVGQLKSMLPMLKVKKTTVTVNFKTQIDADINIQQAYSYYKRIIKWKIDDEKVLRTPAGQRNCYDMRVLVNDFDLEAGTALNVMKQVFYDLGLTLKIDEEKDWQQYCEDYCQSERGNKVYTKEKHLENLKQMIDMAADDAEIDAYIESLYQKKEDDWDEMAEINEAQDAADGLPDFVWGKPKIAVLPPDIWEGLVSRGTKVIIAGPSKTRKSWTMLGIALAIASGKPHWTYKTTQLKTLFCNFEIGANFFNNRVVAVADKMGITNEEVKDWFAHLNLRGLDIGSDALIKKLIGRIKRYNIEVIFLDPLYKLYGDLDENSAGDMSKLMNIFEHVCERTGATLFISHHFAKGYSGNKRVIDRSSGSGVFGRDPDTSITLTPHKDSTVAIVSPILRNHKEVEDFCIRWEYPLMVRDDKLDPTEIETNIKHGSEEKFSIEDILNVLNQTGKQMTTGEITGKMGMSKKTLDRRILDNVGLIAVRKAGKTNTYQITKSGIDFLTKGTYDIGVSCVLSDENNDGQDSGLSSVQ